ncbi:glycosyltransferase family 2 protein [Kineococcus siccus]|uniref:glycosyltransferase family 2 protein n=1 Tax=Kineococcus siccus TaxID=2696567 RepID=UPI0014128322|nr:glycosyltransferase [Kineococcus siccus]
MPRAPAGELVTVGLAVTTIGRPEIAELLRSAAASTRPPLAVAVADQSRGRLALDTRDLPFPVDVVPSSGGVSAGRNDAVRALQGRVDVVGFPNDDSRLPPGTLEQVAEAFTRDAGLAALAGAVRDPDGFRAALPERGTALDARSIWRAVEPAVFLRAGEWAAVGGFRPDVGTGAASPWQSGDGTDLLLRLLERGGRVVSRPDVVVEGRGERRSLTPGELVAKHRGYARGTGFVYRVHPYPRHVRWRTVLGPWLRPLSHDTDPRLSLRLAVARSLGRVEGLLARPLGDDRPR